MMTGKKGHMEAAYYLLKQSRFKLDLFYSSSSAFPFPQPGENFPDLTSQYGQSFGFILGTFDWKSIKAHYLLTSHSNQPQSFFSYWEEKFYFLKPFYNQEFFILPRIEQTLKNILSQNWSSKNSLSHGISGLPWWLRQ